MNTLWGFSILSDLQDYQSRPGFRDGFVFLRKVRIEADEVKHMSLQYFKEGNTMDPRIFLEILHVAERLKDTTRHSYTSGGRHESVGEHSWRAALMAYFLRDEFPEADMDKVIRMCLVHDLGEAFTGDIPTFDKTQKDEKKEEDLLYSWVAEMPATYAQELHDLYEEMAQRQTLEAKIYKAIDGLEALIQHNEADISTWIPHEYKLNLVYANDKVAFSEYLTALRAEIRADTEEKIAKEGACNL